MRGDVQHGNLVGWEPVPAAAILGRLATFGWRVEELPAYSGPRMLALEPTE